MSEQKQEKKDIEIITHEFIPRHELMPEEQVSQLLEAYSITKLQLPKIEKNDPAIRHLAPKVGDVIKITRNSKTAGRAVYYRAVI